MTATSVWHNFETRHLAEANDFKGRAKPRPWKDAPCPRLPPLLILSGSLFVFLTTQELLDVVIGRAFDHLCIILGINLPLSHHPLERDDRQITILGRAFRLDN